MLNKKYSDFIEISPTFESVVDIDADTRNKNLWREYIVGEDMEKMLEVLCQSLNNEGVDNSPAALDDAISEEGDPEALVNKIKENEKNCGTPPSK